jgi:arabinosaccharide transport system substrate-binding protein
MESAMRFFPYGKAALSFLILSLLSGSWIGWNSLTAAGRRTPPGTQKLTFWVFAKPHYEAYRKALPAFEAAHPGVQVDMQLVSLDGLAARLQNAFLADLDVPDMVEIEISSSGTFFRGPLKDVGFADLTDRVHQTGLWDKMVQARFAPYTNRGHIFGLPHDVHPVQLAYRRDLVEAAGIDVRKIQTWDDFIRVGHQLTKLNERYMIELSDSSTDNLETCLFQRGGGYFDPQGKCIFDNEVAVQTLCWYVPLVAGPHRIGNSLGGGQVLTKAVEDGYVLFLIAPDWRSKSFEQDIPRVAGKMALMPLPAVSPGGARTSTWGGTMLGITKRCKNPDLAWQLAMHLYLDKAQLAERFRQTNILPAMREAWDQPAFHEPHPYYSNQPLGDTYARLAPSVPFQYSSPFIQTAKAKLGAALVSCVQEYNAHPDHDLESFARATLKENADDVRKLIARNPY